MPFFRCCAFVPGISACCMASADATPSKKPRSEIISVTEFNLRGHQSLYREGWFVVSATEKAFRYAREHAITSSGQVMSRAVADAGGHSAEYGKKIHSKK